MNRLAGLVALLGLLSGCAWMAVCPVSDEQADTHTHGFRYYEAAPYILVCTDNHGALKAQTCYLPDLTRMGSIRPHNILASHDLTLTFKDGMLTKATSEVDETAVPLAVIKAFEKVAVAAMPAALNLPPGEHEVAPPYLFKVTRIGNQYALVGGQGVGPNG